MCSFTSLQGEHLTDLLCPLEARPNDVALAGALEKSKIPADSSFWPSAT